MKKEDLAAIKAQIELYKKWRKTLQFGEFYRGRNSGSLPVNGVSDDNGPAGNLTEWTCVSEDGDSAVGGRNDYTLQQSRPDWLAIF